ncbi:MAG: hypothetical protein M0009_08790 [Deltaproteobacteria bacterium]|nr:hypothetical protein [Deltaproteobacteria bacterium]
MKFPWRTPLLLCTLWLFLAAPSVLRAQSPDDLLKAVDAPQDQEKAPVASQPPGPSVDDLLKGMDAPSDGIAAPAAGKAASAAAAQKQEGYGDQLVKNLHGSLLFRGMQYLRAPQEREGADMGLSFGNVLAKFTDKIGGRNWDVNFGGWAEFGNETNTYAGTFLDQFIQDTDRRRRIVELNELFLNWAPSASLNLVAGKKTLTNGISTLFIPSDRMRPQDMNDPMNPKDLNRFQVRADYYRDATTFTAVFLPFYQEQKLPSETSRWMGQRNATDTPDSADIYNASNLNMENDRAKLTDTNFGYFGRVKTTYRGWDFFASYYHGPNPYYVVREEQRPGSIEPLKIKEIIKVDTVAAGFSTTKGAWEFHGEALVNRSYEAKDDHYFSYVGGFTYTFDDFAKRLNLEKIDVTVEYANEVILARQSAEGYTSSSKKSRAGRNDIFSRVNLEYSDKLSFQFLSNFILTESETGRFQKFLAKYKLRDGLLSSLSLETFGGNDNGTYGRWTRNDRFILELEYSY